MFTKSENIKTDDQSNIEEKRTKIKDRRNSKLKAFIFSISQGQRRHVRREEDSANNYYTDWYEKWVGIWVIIIACLNSADAFFTLMILDLGGIEINPIMAYLLDINRPTFIFGKIFITSVCLMFILVHVNFKVFKIFSVRYFLFFLAIFYMGLMGYELMLLSEIAVL